jgi:D-alanyl-D-alanine carboxypeptidase (penicillin-binding protein 5/6)
MTAAIVLEFADPSSSIKIPSTAKKDLPPDSAVMGISTGETYTIRQLLYGLLLPSGNDAAKALAVATAGDEGRFVSLMNGKAAQLGLRNTHFTNASGLDDRGHYSTAYDLAVITKYAMSFPEFQEIVRQGEYEIPYTPEHKYLHLVNANSMVNSYPGATGVKPGNTADAGNCLVATATRNGRDVMAILLDTPGRNSNMAKLFDHMFAREKP